MKEYYLPEPDSITLRRVNSIENPRFNRLLQKAKECAKRRKKRLEFSLANQISEIRADVEKQQIQVYLPANVNEEAFEHYAAHELGHIVAGCCGFSYIVIASENLLKVFEEQQENEQEHAILTIKNYIGSFLTHAAIHRLLQASGYVDKNMDNILLEQAKRLPYLEPNLANRAINVGWVIQYEELVKLGLPGLDVQAFKQELRRLLPTFDCDLKIVRSSSHIENILNVKSCLASTKSLIIAFGKLLNYPVEKVLEVDISCKPNTDWSLHTVLVQFAQN